MHSARFDIAADAPSVASLLRARMTTTLPRMAQMPMPHMMMQMMQRQPSHTRL